jgi:hypothetical protein
MLLAATQMTREVFHSESLVTSTRNGLMSTFTERMVSSMEVTITVNPHANLNAKRNAMLLDAEDEL